MSSRIERTAPLASGWDVELVDVDEYLARLGRPRVAPTADALLSLHEAHVRTIPFENVDVLLGSHRSLGLDARCAAAGVATASSTPCCSPPSRSSSATRSPG